MKNSHDLAHGYGDEYTCQITSFFNPMNKHCGPPGDLQPLDLTCSPSLCYSTDPVSCSRLLWNSHCSLLYHLLKPKPPPERQWGKGNSTQFSCHSPCPQNVLCNFWVKNSLKAYNPGSPQVVLPISTTPALSGESGSPQYLRHLTVVFRSSTSRGVMRHKLFRKYKFPSWCHLWQGHSGGNCT